MSNNQRKALIAVLFVAFVALAVTLSQTIAADTPSSGTPAPLCSVGTCLSR